MKIQVGAKLPLAPFVFADKRYLHQKTYTGTVVYVNSKHRYFTARFDFPGGSFFESFKYIRRCADGGC